jgi:hypothetical protein
VSADWTKAEERAMKSALTSWVTCNRPIPSVGGARPGERQAFVERARAHVAEHRKDIVLAGLRSGREQEARAYREACETIGNQLARFTKYGEPDPLIERFTKLAKESDAGHRKLEALVVRVVAYGLPESVLAFDPLASL